MAGSLEPLKVFISSPGDVLGERKAASEIIEKLRRDPAFKGKIDFESVAWDLDHQGVPMDARDSAQMAVDRWVGEAGACDLVVVILWSRLGSPFQSPDGTEFRSGTVYEFEQAWKSEKRPPIWPYLRTPAPPIDPDAPDASRKIEERQEVSAFVKEGVAKAWNDYDSEATFREKFEAALRIWLHSKLTEPTAPEVSSPASRQSDPAALFDALPADHAPEPHHEVLGDPQFPARNHSFVGREAEFLRVAAAVKAGRTAAVVAGMGGVGKSQLAIEFAWRYGRFFAGGVEHLSFADGAAIPSEIARLGQALGLAPDFANLPLLEQERLMRAHWADGRPRLLIFDNCEDPELLRAWRPNQYRTVVLVTCRLGDWPEDLGVDQISLETLPRAESIRLLRGGDDDMALAVLDEIADQLGDLPLALHLARLYLHEARGATNGRPETFLARIRDEGALGHVAFERDGAAPAGGLANVRAVFALSLDRLDPADPTDTLARRLLAHAAFVAPGEPCPPFLLAGCVDLDLEQPADEDACHAALRRLAALGLCDLSEADRWPSFHRLIQAAARPDGDAERTKLEAVAANAAYDQNEAGLPKAILAWQPHLRLIATTAVTEQSDTAATLQNNLGFHLDMTADLKGARTCYERALRIDEAALGPNHENVAIRINNLGSVLRALGDLDEARTCFERAHRIDEAALGPDHPEVATDVNNLGRVLQDLGDLDEARACFERAFRIDEAAFGPDHPNVARDVNNLGSVLQDLGDLDKARACFKRALRIDEAALGPDHPNVAIRVNNLGGVLQDLGDLDEARACCERALRIDEAAFGPDHPSVARDVNNLGGVLQDLGDLDAARACCERALGIFRAALGDDHPSTKVAAGNLQRVLAETDDA